MTNTLRELNWYFSKFANFTVSLFENLHLVEKQVAKYAAGEMNKQIPVPVPPICKMIYLPY